MKKIPTLFKRDPDNMSRLLNEPHPDCDWVFSGEGVATRKLDGTSCMYDGENWWKRREVKKGKSIPDGFKEETFDENTGKRTGWMPVEDSDKWHQEAIAQDWANSDTIDSHPHDIGTYELIGPKIQGNPEDSAYHFMRKHLDCEKLDIPVVGYDHLKTWLNENYMEGIVWHHPDGRMAKIKRRDFGLKWP